MAEHTDDMNDMVLLGIDRDSWKGRAERLQALNAELLAALETVADDLAQMASAIDVAGVGETWFYDVERACRIAIKKTEPK